MLRFKQKKTGKSKTMNSEVVRKSRLQFVLWTVLVLLALTNTLFLWQNQQLKAQIEKSQPQRLKIGESVQGFTAKDLNDKTVNINFSGNSKKRFLLYFTPTCTYCKQRFPEWKELISQAKDKNIEVLGIVSENENKGALEKYLNSFDCGLKSEIPLQILFISNETLRDYKLSLTPTTVLLSGDGKVEQNWIGKWKESDKNFALSLLKN